MTKQWTYRRILAGRRRDIVWVALIAAALSVPAAIADEAGSAGLKADVAKALKVAKKAKKKAGAANKKAKAANSTANNALVVAENTSKQQGPKGDKGDTGATGLANVVVRVNSKSIGMNDVDTVYAQCAPGTTVISGGADAAGDLADVVIFGTGPGIFDEARPTTDGETPDSWFGRVRTGGAAVEFEVYAVCAVPPAG